MEKRKAYKPHFNKIVYWNVGLWGMVIIWLNGKCIGGEFFYNLFGWSTLNVKKIYILLNRSLFIIVFFYMLQHVSFVCLWMSYDVIT